MTVKNKLILFVDYQEDIWTSLDKKIKKVFGNDIKCIFSAEPSLAIKQIDKYWPDYIFLDVTASDHGLNGYDVLNHIEQFNVETKVIIFTGIISNAEREEEWFKYKSVIGIIKKPCFAESFEVSIKHLINFEESNLAEK